MNSTNGSRRSVGGSLPRFAASWWGLRWLILGVVAVGTFVLGWVGFVAYYDRVGIEKSPSDTAYLSLQLFVLESGSVPESGATWELEVARLAAPIVSATAVVSAILLAFREQLAELRLRRQRDHVVICGLGESGARLASELLADGRRVVGIDRDASQPCVADVARRGAEVIVGDARDTDVLERARLDRASHLVCLMGSDDANADVAVRASKLVWDRMGPALMCLIHIYDLDLCELLRADELVSAHSGRMRLDFFNLDEQGARCMIRDHPPFAQEAGVGGAPRVTVIGLNRLGQSLVTEVARQWRAHPRSTDRSLTITVVDPDAHSVIERLRRRYPQLDQAAAITAIGAELDPFDAETALPATTDIAYVCIDDDSVALQTALRARQALSIPLSPIVVELVHDQGLSEVINRAQGPGSIHAFDLHERTLGVDLLLGGTYEILARAIHEEYLREQRRQGATAASNPSAVPWAELPTSLKESNRDQAAHIGTKLAAIDRSIAPLTDWDAHTVDFTDQEIEGLAKLEHERWVEQRRRDGWTSGPKNPDAKTTPYLVGWEALSDEVKELDRQTVRALPAFLARAGYQIVSPQLRPTAPTTIGAAGDDTGRSSGAGGANPR